MVLRWKGELGLEGGIALFGTIQFTIWELLIQPTNLAETCLFWQHSCSVPVHSLSSLVLLQPWDKSVPSYWSQQAVWIDQAAWVGDVAGGVPFTLGSLMSGNLGICSRQPLDQRPVLMFCVFALVRNVLCNQDLSLKAFCLVCPIAEKKPAWQFHSDSFFNTPVLVSPSQA